MSTITEIEAWATRNGFTEQDLEMRFGDVRRAYESRDKTKKTRKVVSLAAVATVDGVDVILGTRNAENTRNGRSDGVASLMRAAHKYQQSAGSEVENLRFVTLGSLEDLEVDLEG